MRPACETCWPFDCLGMAAQQMTAGELHDALRRVADFLDVFWVDLAFDLATARLMAAEAGESEGVLSEGLEVQRERLRGLLAWTAAAAEGAGEWHGGRL